MRCRLLVENLFHPNKSLVKFFRPDHWPWDNIQSSPVKASDEIGVLFLLNYPLEP